MSSFTIDVNIHAQTPIPFHRHIDFSSKNPGESFGACLGSSDWTDPSPPFHPPTLLRGQPQVEQIPNCRKFQNLNKLSFFSAAVGTGHHQPDTTPRPRDTEPPPLLMTRPLILTELGNTDR